MMAPLPRVLGSDDSACDSLVDSKRASEMVVVVREIPTHLRNLPL